MKNFTDTISDRTSDFPICIAGPQRPCHHGPERRMMCKLNTVCTRSIISLEESSICASSKLDSSLKLRESVPSNKIYSRQREKKHVEGTCRM
jgi:hypothetical protein